MKTLWKISTFTFILFTLTACMPDSLTKFKEAPAKDETASSDGGSGGPVVVVPPSTCAVGTDPACTPPGAITYDGTKDYTFIGPDDDLSLGTYEPTYANFVLGQAAYLAILPDTSFATETGFTFSANGDFEGDVEKFLPKSSYLITSTYSTPELPSDEVVTDTIYITMATKLTAISYPHAIGQKLILAVDNITPFSIVAGFNSIATANGVVGRIDYIDSANKELHIEVTANSGTGLFSTETGSEDVDNATSYFTSKAQVTSIYHAFDRTTMVQSMLAPSVLGARAITATETESFSYSIFPSLPTGLHFDESRGTIGTLKAYQTLDDGSITVVAGLRAVTGIGTAFLSQLQVNQSIEINGELHQIETITSNTDMTTYLPFAANGTLLANFKKILSGSVTLTNGSAAVVGVGTSFTNEIVTTKNLVVDAVGTFTGANIAVTTVGTATTLTLGSNYTGTALTIPELKATDYTISAKNILGQSISTIIKIGLLDTIQPKTLTKVQYDSTITDKIIIPATSSSSFVVGGYISNPYGTIALVDYIDSANNNVLATVVAIGSICTDIIYTTSGTCTGAGELWINKNFEDNDDLDNASAFFSAETTATADATRIFAVSNVVPVALSQTVIPTLGAVELASLEYAISPDISAGQGFCDNATYTNEFDCTNNAGNWSQGLLFATVDQCSNPVNLTIGACVGPGEVWILKGQFYGLISTAFPPTTFTVTTTNVLGNAVTTPVIISVNEAPAGLAASNSTLLHVPSYFAFEIGDAISSINGAIGTVTGKFKTSATPPATNANKGTFEYYYLEVKVLEGTFAEFDDIDNISSFTSQKTYILGEGAYQYNTKVSAASTAGFKDPDYTVYAKHDNLLQVGAVDRARVIFNDEVNDNLYLTVYDTTLNAGNSDPATLSTGETLTAVNLAAVTATVTALEANNVIFNSAIGTFSSSTKGNDIATTGDVGIGMLHSYDPITSKVYVSVTEGIFTASTNFDDIAPFVGTVGATGQISNEAAFYFYRGQEGTINFNLAASDSATILTLDKALPAGLSTFSVSGVVAGIDGIPTGPSSKEKYVLTATNSFGSTTYEFFIKVYDHISLADTTGSSSYILHKSGIANGRTPCRVTDDQMNNGGIEVKDITCYLDAGEDELHWNGVKMNISVGDGMCQFVNETPYTFWQYASGTSTPAMQFTHSVPAACTIGAPTVVTGFSSDAAGVTASVTSLQNLCTFDYATQRADPSLPNCDEGSPQSTQMTWSAQPFECVDTNLANAVTADASAADCIANNAMCTGGAATGAEDEATCLALGGGEIWNLTIGSHNNAGANAAGTVQEGTCSSAAGTVSTATCGGVAYNCLSGPRTTWKSLNGNGGYLTGATTMVHNISVSGSSTSIEADYTDGYSGTDYQTNTFYSNYIKTCSSGNYAPEVLDIQNYAIATLSSASHIGGDVTTATFATTTSSKPLYTYVCKSGAGTIKARINMVVRDFDRDFKVKLGLCVNATFTNQIDCENGGSTWTTTTGIDRHDPDDAAASALVGAADVRNFLSNTQTDAFLDPYNRYEEPENAYTGGTCVGGPAFDFDPGAPVQIHPEQQL